MGLVGGHRPREAVEIAIVGVDKAVDGAEGEVGLLPAVAEQRVHRVGPVDPARAMSQSHRPQSLRRSAVSRRQADLLAGAVRQGGLTGLKPVGDADADDHEDRRTDQHDLVARPRSPADHQRIDRLKHRDLTPAFGEVVHGRQHPLAARQAQHDGAGAFAESRKRLARAEDIRKGFHVPRQRRMRHGDPRIGRHQDEPATG